MEIVVNVEKVQGEDTVVCASAFHYNQGLRQCSIQKWWARILVFSSQLAGSFV